MSDTFKKVYTNQSVEIKSKIYEMKEKAEELKAFFDLINSREMSIAQTNLEQALMWATKAWVIEGDKQNAANQV
jgi:hypothetical protein